MKKRQNIAILGSTGSIGTQALDVVRGMGLNVTALCANRSIGLLEKQAREFKPAVVAVMDAAAAAELKIKLADTDIRVLQGMDGFIEAATLDANDVVLNSVVGMVGL
ncbi:MAG: 1-deoxy-D-xylulose-5-phosphate reductoisomerase, partial [Clostridia bacterium]|nr:1-deoxy-D-xylulose-5-phosphate reductoisomerase [Clostridia bacterium]